MARKRHEYVAAGLLTQEESDLVLNWKKGIRSPATVAAIQKLGRLRTADRSAGRPEKVRKPAPPPRVRVHPIRTIGEFVRDGLLSNDQYAGARAYDGGQRTDWSRAGRAAYLRLRKADIRRLRPPKSKPDLLPVPDAERNRIWRKIQKAKAEGLSPAHATELVAITWNCGCHRCQLYRRNHGT